MQLSRTEQKRRIKEVEKLVTEFSKLSPQVIDSCPMDGELKDMLKEVQRLKGGAAKRQLKYITKLLKNEPLEDLYSFIGERKGAGLAEKKKFHEVEYWRDALINEALEEKKRCASEGDEWTEHWRSTVLAELVATYPQIDQVALMRLGYLFAQTRNPKHSREIFRYIISMVEQQAREENF